MKKLILLLLSSVFFISCSKEASSLPDELGDFRLGMSINSVERMLNSKGLNKVTIANGVWVGDRDFSEHSYAVSDTPLDTQVAVHFSATSPYRYDGKNWEWATLGFYQGELYDIQLITYYEGQKGIEKSYKVYKDEEKRLQSLYNNFKTESNQDEDNANLSYEYENKQIFLTYAKDEDLTSLIVLVLRDFEIEDKVYSSSTPVSYNNNLSQLSEQMLGAYIDESNGFRRLTNPITLNTLVVTPSITHGIDGSIYYTGIQIRSLSDPMLQIDYGHFFSAGELQINGNRYVVGEVMDNKIIYDLSPYGSDLYIWGYQYNYDLSGTYIR